MSNGQPEEIFFESLRKTLNHYDDPEWIGKRSPLASPYFLGEHLHSDKQGDVPAVRGQILQTLIRQAFEELWGGNMPASQRRFKKMVDDERLAYDNQGPRYACYLLDMRYLRYYFTKNRPDKRMLSISQYVNVSESSLYVHLQSARQRLGELLLKRIQPIFRPERPSLPKYFVGRDAVAENMFTALQKREAVTISGMGGMGKTTLATSMMHQWGTFAFWFTIRPDLNDHVNSFLFALSNFLFHQGEKRLWNHLRAQISHLDSGKQSATDYVISQASLELLRSDLAGLETDLLLCVDEADRLFSAENHPNHYAHQGLIEFLDMLREHVSLLIIGQKPVIDTPYHFHLDGLKETETKTLLQRIKWKLSSDDSKAIHHYTHGNPRLIWAMSILNQQGEDVLGLLSNEQSPDLRTLFARLWQRLTNDEKEMIACLSVFSRPMPRHSWPQYKKAIRQLIQRGIVTLSDNETVGLLPVLRWHIYQHELVHEQRIQYQHYAGELCAALGEFTDAAVHFKQADDPLSAFRVWYPFKDVELLRGHGLIARSLFESITVEQLRGHFGDELNALKMELDQMAGRLTQVTSRAELVDWSEDSEVAADAQHISAISNWWMGHSEEALDQLNNALTTYNRVAQKSALVHFRRGNIYARQGNIEMAHESLLEIEYEKLRLHGRIEIVQGNLKDAQSYYESAHVIATQLNDERKQVTMNEFVSHLLGHQGKIEEATKLGQQCVDFYQKVHDPTRAEIMRANLAGMWLQVGQFERVIELGEASLAVIERLKHKQVESKLCTYLAEAHYECGNLDKAKAYTQRILQIEEVADLPYATYTLGLICKQENNIPLAIKTFQQGIDIAVQTHDQFIEAYLQRELAKVHQIALENEAADQCLLRAVHLFERMGLEQERQTTQAILDAHTAAQGESEPHPAQLEATPTA